MVLLYEQGHENITTLPYSNYENFFVVLFVRSESFDKRQIIIKRYFGCEFYNRIKVYLMLNIHIFHLFIFGPVATFSIALLLCFLSHNFAITIVTSYGFNDCSVCVCARMNDNNEEKTFHLISKACGIEIKDTFGAFDYEVKFISITT